MFRVGVNFSRAALGVMAVGRAAKNLPTQLAGLAKKVSGVSNSPVSMASSRNLQTQGNQPQQQVSRQISHLSASEPQQSKTTVKRDAPQPTPKMIQEATERKFREGISAGQIKRPDSLMVARSELKMQSMNVDLSPVKLGSENFLRQGDTLQLSPQGEKLASDLRKAMQDYMYSPQQAEGAAVSQSAKTLSGEVKLSDRAEKMAEGLKNALRERQQKMDKEDDFPLRDKDITQSRKTLTPAHIEKMSRQLADTLGAERKPAKGQSTEKPVQMSALEQGIYNAARAREQRLQAQSSSEF